MSYLILTLNQMSMAFYEHTSTTLKFWELILIKFIDAKMIWLTISVHFGISNEVLTVSVLRVRLILSGSGGAQRLGASLASVLFIGPHVEP